ncbi:MAG: cytochrome c oxidase subunit II transmembrane domain-containing protein, partial [Acidimicrobiales bacterium]
MTRHVRRAGGLLAVGAMVLLTSCVKDAPLDTLDPAGPAAGRIDGLWNFVLIIATIVFILFEGALIYALVKFRRRKNEDGEEDESFPEQTHGNFKLEVGWTIAPAIILVFVAVYTVSTVFALEEREPDTVPVDVIGQQWWWEYRYDADELIAAGLIPDQAYERDQIITAAEMMIPATRQM